MKSNGRSGFNSFWRSIIMFRKLFLLTPFVLLLAFEVTNQALGVPLPSGSLEVRTVIDIGKELVASSSMYNPRSLGGKNYVVQINAPQRGVGCYPAGSTIYEAAGCKYSSVAKSLVFQKLILEMSAVV